MSAEATTPQSEPDSWAAWAVTADNVRVWEDAYRILHVSVHGTEHEDVRPRRVFPLSAKSPFVSFLNEKSEEVALLTNPEALDDDSGTALEKALHRLYYAAVITRVDSISEAMGVSLWHVVTDRGYAKFEVVDRQRYIRALPGGRFMMTDADGNRFEIPCVYDLDAFSQRLVETET